MATFQLSPGVVTNEIDLTTIVPAVGTTEGAFAGEFSWGPVGTIVTISNEVELVSTFGKPTNANFLSFFSAANFLAYARNLKVVRAANTASAKNATANGGGLLIENRDKYEINYLGLPPASNAYGMFAARYPGDLGNSLKVSLYAGAGSSNTVYETWGELESRPYYEEFNGPTGTSVYAAGVGGANDELHIIVVDENGKFTGVSNTVLEKFAYVSKAVDATNDDGSSNYYVNVINDRSRYIYILNHAQSVTANIDSIAITDGGESYSNGFITFVGGSGTSANANVSVNSTGAIVTVTINNRGIGYELTDSVLADIVSLGGANGVLAVSLQSNPVDVQNWGTSANSKTFTQTKAFYTSPLDGGAEGAPSNANLITAYDKFRNEEEIDISLIVTGAASQNVSEYIVDNIAEYRKDCVVFISPDFEDVVNNEGDEVVDSVQKRNQYNSSSYAVFDGNWKLQFDKYNNVYRWVPLNADIAGLCVRTDFERDPWFSPAGFNRGAIKNVVKLAWNPDKTNRDELYKNGINPVVSFPGEGVVLYGDKTMLAKPSAFDRINVRRLFIVLKKAIARAAKYSLFEFNDEFTRAQFVSIVEPFLRDIQGRRGIFDFRVVCDTTNNTPEVIDRNEFIGDIYVKPARAISYIQLNFIAVRTGVAFDEVVGRF